MKFIIPGDPVGKGRPRVGMHGMYTPKKTVDYEKLIARCWEEQGGAMFDNVPLVMVIQARIRMPVSWSKKKKTELCGKWHTGKPDTDNIIKSVLDGLNGKAYADDSQVAIIVGSKRWNEKPSVTVEITRLDEYGKDEDVRIGEGCTAGAGSGAGACD